MDSWNTNVRVSTKPGELHSQMTAEEYISNILSRITADTSATSPALAVRDVLLPALTNWGSGFLNSVTPSGSFAKGTAITTGTDIDLFVSMNATTPGSLEELYKSLGERLRCEGYSCREQNVSLNIKVSGFSVDLVPARLQDQQGQDHSLFRRRAKTWTKTNIQLHIAAVRSAGRERETRLIKLWRNQQNLDFPSFYLELSVIRALGVARPSPTPGTWAGNLWAVFKYLRDNVVDARIEDPGNTNNTISDDLNDSEKRLIKAAAERALGSKTWAEIIK